MRLGSGSSGRAAIELLKASVLYFAAVFGAGLVLGAIQILWTVPR